MKKKEAIITFLIIGLALIGGITFCVIFNGMQKEPPAITAAATTAETPVSTLDEPETTKNEGIPEATTTKTEEVDPITTTRSPVITTTETTTRTVVQEIFPEETKPEAPTEPPVTSTSMVSEVEPPVVITTTAPKSSEPKMGDTSGGYIWIDGFGWIEDNHGVSIGEYADSDGDIDKIVGIM